MFDDGRPGRGRGATWPPGWPALSGKFAVLAAMLERLRPTGDRIVIVSNYTQTLDLFVQLCRERGVRSRERFERVPRGAMHVVTFSLADVLVKWQRDVCHGLLARLLCWSWVLELAATARNTASSFLRTKD